MKITYVLVCVLGLVTMATADPLEASFTAPQTVTETPEGIRICKENGLYVSLRDGVEWELKVQAFREITVQVPQVVYDEQGAPTATNMVDRVVRVIVPLKDGNLLVRKRPITVTQAELEAEAPGAQATIWAALKKIVKARLSQ